MSDHSFRGMTGSDWREFMALVAVIAVIGTAFMIGLAAFIFMAVWRAFAS